ncbi:hypothetical protein [Mobilicoccus sp.]|uniref:hypothetical protein n=1 Tax=Mobilicoccus sp. TaxID=2034349 RepID=UPI0028A940A4|nr:hypothetical protein [Mobilicoccus sp.]
MTRRIPAAPTSRRRASRAILLAPIVGLALAGCQWTSPIQTEKQYDPADGRSVSLGGVKVDNLLVVAEKKGAEGTLVGLGVNNTNQPVQVTFAVPEGQPMSIDIKPLSSQQVSEPEGGRSTKVANVPVPPGALLDVTVTSTGVGSQTIQVPVVAPYGAYGAYNKGGTITPTVAEGGDHGQSGEATPTESPAQTAAPTPTTTATTAPASPATTAPAATPTASPTTP